MKYISVHPLAEGQMRIDLFLDLTLIDERLQLELVK
jgi:hypothetical protein